MLFFNNVEPFSSDSDDIQMKAHTVPSKVRNCKESWRWSVNGQLNPSVKSFPILTVEEIII